MPEHDEQVAVIAWASLMARGFPELELLYAVPNGAKLPYRGKGKARFSPEAMRLKAEGLRPGVPDLVLPVARQGYHGLYIEMKYGKNKPTPEQVWWADRLAEQGYLSTVCWGSQEAIDTIQAYLS
jgi:hypothetical protein